MTTTTKSGISIVEVRADCPARFHDSYSAFAKGGCICPAARRDRTRYLKARRCGIGKPAHIDSTGTRRRLQALTAMGYPSRMLGTMLGWTGKIGRVMWSGQHVHRDTARRVAELYERIAGTPGPSDLSRKAAKRSGYAPPLAWYGIDIDDPAAVPNLGGDGADIVDEVAIGAVLAGRLKFTDLREREQLELFRQIDDWGYNRIMDLLRMSAGTVTKWRTRVRYGDGRVAA